MTQNIDKQTGSVFTISSDDQHSDFMTWEEVVKCIRDNGLRASEISVYNHQTNTNVSTLYIK